MKMIQSILLITLAPLAVSAAEAEVGFVSEHSMLFSQFIQLQTVDGCKST